MKRRLSLAITIGLAALGNISHAQNLLVNGGFDSPPSNGYFDGSDPSAADDVLGWEMFLGAADGSYVLVSPDVPAATTDLDMGVGPAGGGIRTAVGSRPVVTPTVAYVASVTTDNYFAATNASLFIDWFDAGGTLLSSSGGVLGDPNGPLTFLPYTQLLSVNGAAPALAAKAGVRFEGGNAGYAGLAADNFSLAGVPEPSSLAICAMGAAWVARRRRRAC